MKTALIMTTIHVPKVLELYRKFDRDCFFFIAGDRKTPHARVQALTRSLGNAAYYSDRDQEKLGHHSSRVIGWNKIMRRNIALLEAIRFGAELVISVDDDNLPMEEDYFHDMCRILTVPFRGLCAAGSRGWFNAGAFLMPEVSHRGFPQELREEDLGIRMEPAAGVPVGVAAGMWLGDPDIDALERMTRRPFVLQASPLLQAGLVVKPGTYSPFNTQNTAILGELAPLLMVWIGVGRYDDIWASYAAQRIMREDGFHVHYGRPWVWQERNPQDPARNLEDERFGMAHTMRLCALLEKARLGRGAVAERQARLFAHLEKNAPWMPRIVFQQARAWRRDLERLGKA